MAISPIRAQGIQRMDSLNLPMATGAVPASLSLETSSSTKAPQGFDLLGLSPELLNALQGLGFTNPTAVQAKAIPLAMPPKDVGQTTDLLVSSQTGSGKTVAFLLPVLHRMLLARQQKAAEEASEWARKLEQAQAEIGRAHV